MNSIDVPAELRRRLRLAAAKHDRTVGQYVREAIEERLRDDLGDENEAMLALTAKTDPVWPNCGTTRKTRSMTAYNEGMWFWFLLCFRMNPGRNSARRL